MKIIGFYILVLCFCSCFSTTVYSPSIDRTTTVKEKNEIIGGIGLGFSEHILGANAHLQYSPLSNIGVQANARYGNLYKTMGFAIGGYSGSILKEKEKALGYYFDAYLGYNYHRINGRTYTDYFIISNRNFGYDFTFDYQYQVFSIQTGFHLIRDKISLDVVARPSLIDIISVEIFGDSTPIHRRHLTPLNDDPFFITDVSAKVSFGKEKVKMYVAMSMTALNKSTFSVFRDPFSAGVGINIFFSKL